MRFGAELQSAEENKLNRRWKMLCGREQGKVFTAKYAVTFPSGGADELEQRISSACQGKVSLRGVGGSRQRWTAYKQKQARERAF